MGVYTDPDFFKVSTGYKTAVKRVNDSWILFFSLLSLKKKENKDWKFKGIFHTWIYPLTIL